MFSNYEATPEDEDEIIRRVAEEVHKRGMEIPAIIMLETLNPLSFMGATMGRLFLSPVLPALGEDLGMKGEIVLQVFEKHSNIEKLISLIEAMTKEEKTNKAPSREEGKEDKSKKGWRRFLPF
ncbi:MAG: hypothetical protein JSV27_07940 [Candidatus Bathyarchaeota archaeon]|nr:MAG: hypothetical protein JSV27_07940 [Candidatus Bathyarchaeota archaeon]